MTLATFFLVHFLQFFYAPHGQPWYTGNVWGNVVAVSILVPAGWVWSRTSFWPLRPIKRALGGLHEKADALAARHEDIHAKLDALAQRHDSHSADLQAIRDHLGI